MKVLIADKFPEHHIEKLKNSGIEVIYNPKLGENDLPEAAKNVDCLVVRSTVVSADTIEKSEKLDLIVRAGSGVNNINIAAANKKGIFVANCPGKNSIAVAELAIGLMISLDRRIAHNVIDFRRVNGIKVNTPKRKVSSVKTWQSLVTVQSAKKLQREPMPSVCIFMQGILRL
jgi:D-3-phosphoglycerate dehydrogenase